MLDSIRGTSVNAAEPGQITQAIGASLVPRSVIQKTSGDLLDRFKIDIIIPGLLFIDTPGHEAFTTLRRRGGSISDMAVLVVDINEGFQPQTVESLEFIKQFKTPFVVAATKIDLIYGWQPQKTSSFLESLQKQSDKINDKVEELVYRLVSQLSEKGFQAERFDRVSDFTKQVAVVPCSGRSGEGVSELLVMLAGLSQKFLKDRLSVSNETKGAILEVKEVKGLGTTVDMILYDGSVKVGDFLVVGGKNPLVTKIKALLMPPVLKELRIEKKFESVKQAYAAVGIKISAPNLENTVAGSPIICVSSEKDIERAKKELQQELEVVEFVKDIDGVIAKADTIGGLEALIKIMKDNEISVKKAEIGQVTKQDIIELEPVKDELSRVILCFNVGLLPEAKNLVREKNIPVFKSNIIYRIVEDYKKWRNEKSEREKQQKLDATVRPCRIRILSGFVFRKRQPAIFGVEILDGVLRVNTPMKLQGGKDVGKVRQLEKEGKNIQAARTGDKVAVSMNEPTIGRQINEGDILISVITIRNAELLRAVWDKLQDDEKSLLREWKLV